MIKKIKLESKGPSYASYSIKFDNGVVAELNYDSCNSPKWVLQFYCSVEEIFDETTKHTIDAIAYMKTIFPKAQNDQDIYESEGDTYYNFYIKHKQVSTWLFFEMVSRCV